MENADWLSRAGYKRRGGMAGARLANSADSLDLPDLPYDASQRSMASNEAVLDPEVGVGYWSCDQAGQGVVRHTRNLYYAEGIP
jgi:hypothetical protein